MPMNDQVEVLETGHRSGRAPCGEAQRLFEKGAEELQAGSTAEALASLRRANELAPDHARIRSLLGVAIAREERNFEESRALCESAAKQEFFNPDLYLNLSQVYLGFGRRSEALRYLRRGQMIDPGHAPINRAIAELGRRRLPVLPFLPRRHPFNRMLGTVRNRVIQRLIGN